MHILNEVLVEAWFLPLASCRCCVVIAVVMRVVVICSWVWNAGEFGDFNSGVQSKSAVYDCGKRCKRKCYGCGWGGEGVAW